MAEPKFVLIAEDDDDIRQLICDSIRTEAVGMNLQLVQVKDAVEAMSHVSRREFHCVITDLKMPRAGGEELIKTLQGDALNANTPMVVVSGHMDDDFAARYKNTRAFRKPFVPQELGQAVVREIRLGRTDDRVPVHLINPFTEATQAFVTEIGDKPVVTSPAVKKPGEAAPGDFHCTLIFTAGPVQSRFTVSFQRDWLAFVKTKHFVPKNEQAIALPTDGVARQACLSIFEKMIPDLTAIMGSPPRISGMSIVNATRELDCADLTKASGIVVGVDTAHGRVVLGAYSKGKTRRI
ncbi:MAG TPA: response regulator [Bdellovibrionales bacterium]|nr:response regulator [Bdellovibrionales bacterium]